MTEPRHPSQYPGGGAPWPPQQGPPPEEPRGPATAQNVAVAIAVVLALALTALVVWYLAFRSDGGEEAPTGVGSVFASATSLDFGDQEIGRRSPTQTVRLVNAGDGPLTLGELELAGENPGAFALVEDTDCVAGETLQPEAACSVAVQFTPTARGTRSAVVRLDHSGEDAPLEIALRGAGVGEALPSVSTTRVEFGRVAVGRRARAQEVVLENGGTAPLAIEQLLLRGDHAGDFPLAPATTCTDESRLQPGQSCAIAVAFRPAVPGRRSAELVVRHDAGDEDLTIELRGTGEGRPRAALEPRELDLGTVEVADSSQPAAVTLVNRGTAPLTIDALLLGGPQSAEFSLGAGTTCSTEEPVPDGGSCTIEVVFAPAAPGERVATLLVVHDAPARVSRLELSGEGEAVEEPPPAPPEEPPPEEPAETAPPE